ncbi:LPXTG cell wall anchor domain-containing protein [Actinokineospora inagensis]|uniref:LPXTG cell wall anchor domain-containing protein n=1 Tax=Actinokineospora inagensis TaxID=103730 RepID=UPI000416C118|nr:SdrD B-like domain-containing protein [Actinokineospora inagensis]
MRRTSVRRAVTRVGVVVAAFALSGTLVVPSATADETTAPAGATAQPEQVPTPQSEQPSTEPAPPTAPPTSDEPAPVDGTPAPTPSTPDTQPAPTGPTTEPDSTKPSSTSPDPGTPAAEQPADAKPDASKPDSTTPDADKPEAEQPAEKPAPVADKADKAAATVVTAAYSGQVYADANGNNQYDQGEGVSGLEVWAVNLSDPSDDPHGSSTDAQGGFSFTELTVGSYAVGFYNADHTGVAFDDFELTESGRTGVLIRATGDLQSILTASVAFDKPTYHAGDPVIFTFTFGNVGTADQTGVRTLCSVQDDFDGDWTPIGYFDEGITVVAGKTETVHVKQTIPDTAGKGAIEVQCAVYSDQHSSWLDYVEARASAQVLVAETNPVINPVTNPGNVVPAVNPVVPQPVPVAQASITPSTNTSLAETGANVTGLAWAGLIALIAGAGAVIGTSRRRRVS